MNKAQKGAHWRKRCFGCWSPRSSVRIGYDIDRMTASGIMAEEADYISPSCSIS